MLQALVHDTPTTPFVCITVVRYRILHCGADNPTGSPPCASLFLSRYKNQEPRRTSLHGEGPSESFHAGMHVEAQGRASALTERVRQDMGDGGGKGKGGGSP